MVLLFTQYTPYCHDSGAWDEAAKEAYASSVFSLIDEYAPGFKASVVGKEVLTPPDLERIFSLTGGVSFLNVDETSHSSILVGQCATSLCSHSRLIFCVLLGVSPIETKFNSLKLLKLI